MRLGWPYVSHPLEGSARAFRCPGRGSGLDFQKEDTKAGEASSVGASSGRRACTQSSFRGLPIWHGGTLLRHTTTKTHCAHLYTSTYRHTALLRTTNVNTHPNCSSSSSPISAHSSRQIQVSHNSGRRGRQHSQTPEHTQRAPERWPSRHTCRTALTFECSVHRSGPSSRHSHASLS